MSDEQTESTALIPTHSLADDQLLAISDQAERRIEAVLKIKRLALRVTNPHDWVDQNGKPYLQVSGAEKIARLFGISWQVEEPSLEWAEDGHFLYTYTGTFSLGATSIEAIGTRSSNDKFFAEAKGAVIPPSQIERGDVKKAAYTNCLGNGITRLLGLRNLTWEEVTAGGIDRSKSAAVAYKSEAVLPNWPKVYGADAGKPLSTIATDPLIQYLDHLKQRVLDPKAAEYRVSNTRLIDAIEREMDARRDRPPPAAAIPDPPVPASALSAATATTLTPDQWVEAIDYFAGDPTRNDMLRVALTEFKARSCAVLPAIQRLALLERVVYLCQQQKIPCRHPWRAP